MSWQRMLVDYSKKALGARFGAVRLSLANRSPEIYLAAGIGAGVAATVMLARAHKKSDEVFAETATALTDVHEYVKDSENDNTPVSKAEEQKMLLPIYVEGARLAIILYGPGVLMGMSAIAFILASNGILKKRNGGLMAAVALLDRGFNEYRKQVAAEYGEEVDQRFYYGAEARGVTTLEEGPDGKKTKTKGKKNHIPEEVLDPMMYQRIFDGMNRQWSPDPDMNDFFLQAVQNQFNDKLYLRGYVLLNEVYKALGFEETPYGCVVGWSRKVLGDGFISFGLDSDINQREGDERYLLDFNVSGVIYEHVGTK